MRFVELAIESFKALERAHVRFGPGLNVLYGPNDLGKSTLARAIRAALLVQVKAAEAQDYSSWYADATPRVVLTFSDDSGHYWRIDKTFGSTAKAELSHSKDGSQFTIDTTGRQVEEKIRGILQWGIAAPGGRGAPRLPESFLARALLAAQTDVDAILQASLDDDPDESGKLRLRAALATLAQDPRFKRVLDAAQAEYEVFFTASGRRRATRESRFSAASEAVKKHENELDRLRREREESRAIEATVLTQRATCTAAEHRLVETEVALEVARSGLANARRRGEAAQQLKSAEQALAAIDAQAAQLAELERRRQHLAAQGVERQHALAQADAECERRETELRATEEVLQRAITNAADQARELRKAELDRELAQCGGQRVQLEAHREKAEQARHAQQAQTAAASDLDVRRRELTARVEALTAARAAVQTADRERELSRGVLAYGRWRAADDAARREEEQRKSHQTLMEQARSHDEHAHTLREQHARRMAELSERRSLLPTPERLKELDGLRQQLERAEAALGGGLSIRITARRPGVPLRAAIDRAPARELSTAASQLEIEAQRSAQLSIDDLLEIEVTAGAAERRREVAALRQRWEHEVVPVLQKAGGENLADLANALDGLRREDDAASALRQQADVRAAGATSAREQAARILEQLEGRERDDVPARRAAIGDLALDLLEPRWRELGPRWQARAEAQLEQGEELQAAARVRSSEREREHALATYQLREAETKASERNQQAETFADLLRGRPASDLLSALAAQLTVLDERRQELERTRDALAQEASAERAQAETARTAAQTAREHARTLQAQAQRTAETAQAELNTAIGAARAQAEQLARHDRPSALERMQRCAAQLHACPAAPLSTESDVAEAEAALSRARRTLAEHHEDLHKAEGALTRIGGAQLQDRLQQEEEALGAAQAHEQELALDADAWKLLRDTLLEAETQESHHLGIALARPVGERLRELTDGRYHELGFDPHMKAAGLQATGGRPDASVLDGLSLGTRNQLATLVRLTIACQLKSAIVLDDHLVHTDPARLGWFRDVLRRSALETQILVLTCRPEDYLEPAELPTAEPMQDLAGGAVRAIDLTRLLDRWSPTQR